MNHFLSEIVAVILLIFGIIEIVDGLFPKFPIRLKMPESTHATIARFIEKGSLPASFILGILVGLFEFPCVGGPYLFVLGLLHDTTTELVGLGYLILYNVIFVLPLIAVLLVGSNKEILAKIDQLRKENNRTIRIIGGIIMIALAAIVLFFL